MDIEKLIVLVEERTPLWDQRLPRYSNQRNVQMKLWEEIGAEMNLPVNDIKKKWKGLRDTFRKELRKFLEEKSVKGDDSLKQWPYFSQMEFLSDIMIPKDTQTSTHDAEFEEPEDDVSQPEINSDTNNSDYHFLISLLPYMRQIPTSQKLQARVDVINVLIKHTTT